METHIGHVTRAIVRENLQEKCRTRSPQEAFCVGIYRKNAGPQSRAQHFVRACTVETHVDMSKEPFCAVIYRKNAGPVFRARHFVRACAVETHMIISQEPFYAVIYKEKC